MINKPAWLPNQDRHDRSAVVPNKLKVTNFFHKKNNSKFKIQIVVLQLTGGGEEDVTSGLEFFASSLFPMEKQTPYPDSKMMLTFQ